MNFKKYISESKDVTVYQKLLLILGNYCENFPSTGVETMFNTLADNGKKTLPKDKKALEILDYMLCKHKDSGTNVVNEFLNYRFSDLPACHKPMIKAGRKNETVFWNRNGTISDKVKDLVDFTNTGKSGNWCDVNGKKVTLIDIDVEKAHSEK